MLTLISFLFVFGTIVFIHELGHFVAARLNGIRVIEFSLGMGPLMYSVQGPKTLYSIKWFPIGGSVRMEGEDESSDSADSFGKKAAWRRLTVVLAGPVMNFVLALVVLFLISMSIGYQSTSVASFVPGFPAEASGLEVGDTIIDIDDTPIDTWEALTLAVGQSEGKALAITVLRGDKTQTFMILPKQDSESNRYMIGIAPTMERSPGKAMQVSWQTTRDLTKMIIDFIPRLITGKESLDQVAGPVGIATVVGQAASLGFVPLLTFTAFISINLGIMNLLPLPALDGGRILLILFEMVFKKRLPEKIEAGIHYAGFVLLLSLMVIVLVNDVFRLFKG